MECIAVGCKDEANRKNTQTCEKHYMRMRRNGDFYNRKRSARGIEFSVNDKGCFEVFSHKEYTNGYFLISIDGCRKD